MEHRPRGQALLDRSGQSAHYYGSEGPCPLRARPDEHSRAATVTRGQTVKIPAGHGISRWQASSATDFPS